MFNSRHNGLRAAFGGDFHLYLLLVNWRVVTTKYVAYEICFVTATELWLHMVCRYNCDFVDLAFSSQADVKEMMPELESGCARAEPFRGRKPTDMFSFLLSHHRRQLLDFHPNNQRRDVDNMAASKAQRFNECIELLSVACSFSLFCISFWFIEGRKHCSRKLGNHLYLFAGIMNF